MFIFEYIFIFYLKIHIYPLNICVRKESDINLPMIISRDYTLKKKKKKIP